MNKHIPTLINCPIALGNNSFDLVTNFNIFPNPANNQVTIETNELTNVSLEIYDINGRKLQQQSLQNTNTINIENLQAGVYFFKINSDQGSTMQRVIKI